ncbi:MAG: GntR family transcriptional regulator [Oscillospiraceae bacterium]|nr:GntR family transcriptional regulator [Oscillospiraceae bacterium]
MAKIKKQSLVDQIYAKLREEILTLKLPLGSRINVNDIQEELGVSSTPLREALNRLQQDGLIVMETNIGASVLSLDEHDIEEIEELAFVFQSAAVRFSMVRGDRALMAERIEEQIRNYKEARTARDCTKAVYELIGTFYHYCGNKRLDNSMIALQGQVLLLRYIYALCPDCHNNQDLLEKILSGVKENDTEAILNALQEYSRRSQASILEWIRNRKS